MILINFMNIKFLTCFIFNNFKFDISFIIQFQKMASESGNNEILVGNIVHLWKGTKMEQYAITVGWQ